ncbi:MAG: DUF4160 domain-containing protein [Armatimonadetes bacterium]|nr:DUF4160 domain-containing protein [Armatimonadota bacterium]
MGRVQAFEVEGLDLQFRPNDHTPPHFHAVKVGQWEVMVDIRATTKRKLVLSGVKAWSRDHRSDASEQRVLRTLVVDHREELLGQFHVEVKTDEQRRRDRSPQ